MRQTLGEDRVFSVPLRVAIAVGCLYRHGSRRSAEDYEEGGVYLDAAEVMIRENLSGPNPHAEASVWLKAVEYHASFQFERADNESLKRSMHGNPAASVERGFKYPVSEFMFKQPHLYRAKLEFLAELGYDPAACQFARDEGWQVARLIRFFRDYASVPGLSAADLERLHRQARAMVDTLSRRIETVDRLSRYRIDIGRYLGFWY